MSRQNLMDRIADAWSTNSLACRNTRRPYRDLVPSSWLSASGNKAPEKELRLPGWTKAWGVPPAAISVLYLRSDAEFCLFVAASPCPPAGGRPRRPRRSGCALCRHGAALCFFAPTTAGHLGPQGAAAVGELQALQPVRVPQQLLQHSGLRGALARLHLRIDRIVPGRIFLEIVSIRSAIRAGGDQAIYTNFHANLDIGLALVFIVVVCCRLLLLGEFLYRLRNFKGYDHLLMEHVADLEEKLVVAENAGSVQD